MSERYDHPTGQVPSVRRGPSRATKLATGAGVAVVLALLILNVAVWSNWSGQPGTPVGSVATPTGHAEPAEITPPAEPEASPGTDGTAGQGGAGTGGGGDRDGGADPGGGSGGGGAPDPDPESPDPEEPEEPEIVVIDPAVVLPLITPVVTEVVPGSCLNNTTAVGTIEISALDGWYPMTVEYRWLRSGEFIGPTQSVEVDGNTTLPVAAQLPSTEAGGWVALEVKGPIGIVSEQVPVPSCVS